MTFNPFLSIQFGFARDFFIKKTSLGSIRIFYEIFSMSYPQGENFLENDNAALIKAIKSHTW